MRIAGKNYKSLNFTFKYNELQNCTKTQTFRCLFIPRFKVGETVIITFNKIAMYFVKIVKMYPKQVKNLDHQEAIADGFSNAKEFQEAIMELNKVDKEQWGFVIKFKKEIDLMHYINVVEVDEK